MNSVFAESGKPGKTKEFFRKSARVKKKSESFFNFPEDNKDWSRNFYAIFKFLLYLPLVWNDFSDCISILFRTSYVLVVLLVAFCLKLIL